MLLRVFTLFLLCIASGSSLAQTEIKITDNLWLVPLSKNAFVHVSVMHTEQFGKILANGVIYISGKEAVIMDTPPTEEQSRALLDWLNTNYTEVKVKAVIVNHFHFDCLGGLKVFHERGIQSWSHDLTPAMLKMKKDTLEVPHKTFSSSTKLRVGKTKIECYYPGEAHTRDNIVIWVGDEKLLFGGCMVKAMNAAKGNVADANVAEWSKTIERVAARYPNVKIVVPGHGAHGGKEILEFTAKLFADDRK